MADFPYRFGPVRSASSLHADYDGLDAGAETGVEVSVAGRIMLHRPTGKLCFSTLRDSTGSIQLFSGTAWTEEFYSILKLSLGDWIGATGEVVKTRTGELSVKVQKWVSLAEARRNFGDKW